MNYTYVLRCADGSLYTGWTNNLARRVVAHNAGTGAKYTKPRRPVGLVYYELHADKMAAMRAEARIKQCTRTEKEAYIQPALRPLTIDAAGYTLTIFAPPEGCDRVVYLPLSPQAGRTLWKLLPQPCPVLVCVDGCDWGRDFTPWAAENVRADEPPFVGGADAFLQTLTEKLLPAAETALGLQKARRAFVGYSLAGLFAVYAALQSTCFSAVGSVSGSLWYDDFAAFVAERVGRMQIERVYFSVGGKEKSAPNRRMARIETCTQEICAAFAATGCATIFERNPGGHFHQPELRMAKAIAWLLHDGAGGFRED